MVVGRRISFVRQGWWLRGRKDDGFGGASDVLGVWAERIWGFWVGGEKNERMRGLVRLI